MTSKTPLAIVCTSVWLRGKHSKEDVIKTNGLDLISDRGQSEERGSH